MLLDAPFLLKKGGRIAIITFMSLDDRLVKDRFRELSILEGSRHGPALLPEQIAKPDFALVTSAQELDENRRAMSGKLRIMERI